MLFFEFIWLAVITFIEISKCDEDIVQRLLKRYHDESTECFSPQNKSRPLYMCSGIIIRGVGNCRHDAKYVWSLKPSDKEKNSFAMAFLRKNHEFLSMGRGYVAGFIIYPHLLTPPQKTAQKVLCAFPLTAQTDFRSDRGCGQRPKDETGISQPCGTQNITNLQQWLMHFNRIVTSDDPRLQDTQCGFDMTNELHAAQNFAIALQANSEVRKNPEYAAWSDELRVEGWDENNTTQMPIEAFFYFVDSKNGLARAIKYQHDFFTKSGEMVPIVGIRLPSTANPDIYITQPSQMNSTESGKESGY